MLQIIRTEGRFNRGLQILEANTFVQV